MIVVMHVVKAVTEKPALANNCLLIKKRFLPTLSRRVEEDEGQLLRELLKEIPPKTSPASSVFGCAELSTELDEEFIDAIAINCQYIFSIDYVMDNFPIFNRQVAKEIFNYCR